MNYKWKIARKSVETWKVIKMFDKWRSNIEEKCAEGPTNMDLLLVWTGERKYLVHTQISGFLFLKSKFTHDEASDLSPQSPPIRIIASHLIDGAICRQLQRQSR